MPGSVSVKWDQKGISALLTGAEVSAVTTQAADAVADRVRVQLAAQHSAQNRGRKRQSPPDVDVRRVTTDRAHDTVMIHGAAAETYQVRDGVFTRAVGAAGLKFRAARGDS